MSKRYETCEPYPGGPSGIVPRLETFIAAARQQHPSEPSEWHRGYAECLADIEFYCINGPYWPFVEVPEKERA